jgi:SSS family solute:Na+ symporter
MLACLAGPFIAGVFWMRPGRAAILTAASVGLGVRVVFLALQPTFYGVENNILHVPNTLVTEAFDGWATLLAFAISMSVFVLMAWLRPRTAGELEYELQVVEALRLEQEKELATAPELAPTAGAGVTAS